MTEAREPGRKASLLIRNRLGLHARAAALFVQAVSGFDAEIFVTKDDQTVNGKSIMGLMMLAAAQGNSIDVEVRGLQADEALAAIEALVEGKFREDE